LIKAYLSQVSECYLDAHSRRYSAHIPFLNSLDLFSDFDELSKKTKISGNQLRNWVIEAYAVIALGFPTDVENYIVYEKALGPGILSQIRLARSQSVSLFDTEDTKTTLEQKINNTMETWSFSDGINDVLVFYPKIREQLLVYVQDYFNLKYKSFKHLIRDGIDDLLDFLMTLKN